MPFFSIIIPLYNKENYIQNTINSVLSQTFSDFEVLIIDDGSTDNSAEIVSLFIDSRIKYHYKKNEGVSTARNLGIEKSTTNYITFLDADDYWYPDFLEEMYKYINQFPEQKVFSAAIEIEIPGKVFASEYSIKRTGDFEIVNYFEASYKETVICTSSAVFHNSVFKEIGGFDPTIRSGQDTDLWIRIGMKYRVLFCWKILARYVYDPSSLSKNINFLNKKMNFEKFIEEEKTNLRLKKFLDLNRYSLAIKSKIINDSESFKNYYQGIKMENLSVKKKIILLFPGIVLKVLIKTKNNLAKLGIGNSIFR